MRQIEVQLEEPLRYESSVVEDAGLLLSPLDNLLYELSYLKTSFGHHDEHEMSRGDVVDRIKDSKIPKEDVLKAIMGKPDLKRIYGDPTEVYEYLTSL